MTAEHAADCLVLAGYSGQSVTVVRLCVLIDVCLAQGESTALSRRALVAAYDTTALDMPKLVLDGPDMARHQAQLPLGSLTTGKLRRW